jgi:hypothetical protein
VATAADQEAMTTIAAVVIAAVMIAAVVIRVVMIGVVIIAALKAGVADRGIDAPFRKSVRMGKPR